MKTQNKLTGRFGEDLAAKFLEKKGYKILKRNWGSRWGEIDIIGEVDGVIVFVEVKTKTSLLYGSPTQMVDSRKLQQIARMAAVYPAGIKQMKRIDVVTVLLNRDHSVREINHYQGVY